MLLKMQHAHITGKAVELQREFLIRVNKLNKERSCSRNNKKIRNSSRKYAFRSEDGDIIQICSKCFLGTLGYANEHVISWVFNNLEEKAVTDTRGCHEPVHKMPREEVDAVIWHIESFHPAIIHYRRADLPLRRYLPPPPLFPFKQCILVFWRLKLLLSGVSANFSCTKYWFYKTWRGRMWGLRDPQAAWLL